MGGRLGRRISADDTTAVASLPSVGVVSTSQGGTGQDTSGVTGIPELRDGTWHFPPTHISLWSYLTDAQKADVLAYAGATDVSTALQEAVQDAYDLGAPLVIPYGLYRFTSTILFPYDAGSQRLITILGSGMGRPTRDSGATTSHKWGTILWYDQTNGTDAIATETRATFVENRIVLRDFTLIGPDAAAGPRTTTSGHGIKISGNALTAVDFIELTNVRATHFYGSGKSGIYLENPEDSVLNTVLTAWCDTGLTLKGAFNANTLINVQASYNATQGIYIEDSQSSTFTSPLIQANEQSGLVVKGVNDMTFLSPHFEGNNSSSTAGEGALKLIAATNYANQHLTFISPTFNGTKDTIETTGGAAGGWNHSAIRFLGGRMNSVTAPKATLNAYTYNWIFDEILAPADFSDAGTNNRVISGGVHYNSGWSGGSITLNNATGPQGKAAGGTSYTMQQITAKDVLQSIGPPTVLADSAVMGLGTKSGFYFVVSGDDSSGGIFFASGSGALVAEIADSNARYTVTKDSASSINFYWDTTEYKIQNKRGGDRTVVVHCLSEP
jgi:hypothetical protein